MLSLIKLLNPHGHTGVVFDPIKVCFLDIFKKIIMRSIKFYVNKICLNTFHLNAF